MRRFARMSTVDVARHRVQRDLRQPVLRDALMKAERASAIHILPKMAHKTKDGWRFRKIPGQVLKLDQATRETVMAALPAYRATLSPDHRCLFTGFDLPERVSKLPVRGSWAAGVSSILLFGGAAKIHLFFQLKE